MARANVELIVEAAKAINPLRKVEQHSKKVDQALKKNQKSARGVEAAFQRMGRNSIRSLRDLEGNAARLGKSMGGLRGGIVKAAVAFAGFKSVQVGIARLESERRIKALAKSYGEAAQLQNAATSASKKFKISQTEANTALAGVFARLRPVGVSLKDIVSTYNGFNTAARISGATAVEASNAFTQLAQALGSGALRGDEFNSISEQVPGILTAISKETGVAQGQLRKFAADGKITSDVVIKALKRIETEGADQLTSALGGPAAKIKEFQNAVEDVQVAATESAIPAITEAISDLGTVIKQLEPAIRFVGGLLAGVAKTVGNIVENIAGGGKLAAAQAAANQAATLQARNKFGPNAREGITPGFKEFRDQVLERELSRRLAIARGAVPGQLPPSAADIGATTATTATPISVSTGGGKGAAAKERVDMSQELFDLNKRLLVQSDALTEAERIVLNFQIEKQKIAEANLLPREEEIALLEAAAGFEQDILDRREEQQKVTDEANKKAAKEAKRQEEEAQRRLEADPGFQMQQQLEKLLDTQNQVAFAATSMGDAFANAFGDVVTGAKTGQEALADMLKSIASDFLAMAKKIIAQQLAMILYGTIMKALGVSMPGGDFNSAAASPGGSAGVAGIGGNGFISPFAEGGYVNKPTNALIGEGGEPEYVIPESKMRESMSRYSRGSRGGGVIPSDGGSSASGDGGTAVAAPIDVRYTVERINSVDYVTADQFQSGMQRAAQQGAQRGEQNTLKRLQLSSGTRRRVGM